MKLTRIEAIGFKSFAKRIAINFDGEIVGIVGPNGSGKSNINDAIKWVLGEQSSKNLRGDSMEDVIFSGSKGLNPMKYAEVSLTFDNTLKKSKIPHRKIVITRRIERGGKKNNYYINGEDARLRDLKNIAMESGIGKSSLAIISQGTVAHIAESSPQDRRNIFEEAAGISKYKSRKREAISKLEKTTEALDKLNTITSELYKQVEPLKKQAYKADIYINKRKELKNVEVSLLAYDIAKYETEFESISESLKIVLAEKESLESRIEKIQTQISSKSEYKYTLDSEIQKLDGEHSIIADKLLQLEIRNSKSEERRKLLLEGDFGRKSSEQLKALEQEVKGLSTKIKVYDQWIIDIGSEISGKKIDANRINSEISKVRLDKTIIQEQMYKLKSQLEVLNEYEKNKSNLFKGTKTIIDNKSVFSGYKGTVADLIKVDRKYEKAIESVLKNALQHIVVEDSETAIQAIKFLKENRGGIATFIPLKTIKPKEIGEEFVVAAKSFDGFIGVASNLVNVSSKFQLLNEFLLGKVLVADNIDTAKNISNAIGHRTMIITLDGDIIRTGGVMSGGYNLKTRSLLNIDKQISDLKIMVPKLIKQIRIQDGVAQKKEDELNELYSSISELRIKQIKTREKANVLKARFDSFKAKFESQSDEKLDLRTGIDIVSQIQKLEVNKSGISSDLSVKRTKIMGINDELQLLTSSKIDFEGKLRKLMYSSSNQINEKDKMEFYISNARKRLAETYNITYESIVNNIEKISRPEKSRVIIKTLKSEIRKLGSVNVDSITDYDKINARYLNKKKNQDELIRAQEVIMSAIDEMDLIMIAKFDKTTKAINNHLQGIFKHMFDGGNVEIKYSDPSDLLTTGIEIVAQPPGKAVRTLKLFSGGEKSLIAISLLFAILEYKPLPLCILDEVEAALDEININKFVKYLKKLKKNTQFIIVTHRIGTMENLDVLLGATMQSHGVTSIFSVKMAHAKKIIEIAEEKNL